MAGGCSPSHSKRYHSRTPNAHLHTRFLLDCFNFKPNSSNLIGAVYIPPDSAQKLPGFVDQLGEPAVLPCKHRPELLLAGVMNARHSMWGDKITNEQKRILMEALHASRGNLDVTQPSTANFHISE